MNHSSGDLFTCEDNMLISRVKISCSRAKAHLVFHWCLYNKYNKLFTAKIKDLRSTISRQKSSKPRSNCSFWQYFFWSAALLKLAINNYVFDHSIFPDIISLWKPAVETIAWLKINFDVRDLTRSRFQVHNSIKSLNDLLASLEFSKPFFPRKRGARET